MFLDIASDLHIDHYKNNPIDFVSLKNKESTVLVLAGDIGNNEEDIYNILDHVRYVYEHIVIVDGNHEHYFTNSYVSEFTKRVQDYINKEYDNITFLDGNNSVKIEDTVIVGANGWYDWRLMEPAYSYEYCNSVWHGGMNDARYIMFDDDNYNDGPAKLARKQVDQIKEIVESLQTDDSVKNVVAVTHTVPRKEFLVVKNQISWDSLSASFGNSLMSEVLEADTNNKIKVWAFGHTHHRSDAEIDNVRYVNNARGYPFENREMGEWTLKQVKVE